MSGPLLSIAALISSLAISAGAQDAIDGVWMTAHGDAEVRVAPCVADRTRLCGSIVWLKDAYDEGGQPVRDVNNPDAKLRDRPLIGLQLLRSLKPAGENHWAGVIYNPDTGKTYRSHVRLTKDGGLRVEGCLLLFCGGETWRRIDPPT